MKRTLWIALLTLSVVVALPIGGFAATVNLTMTDQNPEVGWGPVNALIPWVQQVEKATNGEVKITIYHSQVLSKGKDAWQAVKANVADMGWCFHGYWPGMTPLADVISLPGLPIKSAEQASAVLWKLYQKYPQIREGFQDNQVLLLFTSTQFFIISKDKPVKTIEDIKGLKIRSTGGPPTDQIANLGATPVSIPMPDCYLSLRLGTIDAMGTTWEPINAFKLYEVAKYFNYVKLCNVYFSIVMNKGKWKSLSEANQKAIMGVSGLEGSKFFGRNWFDSAKGQVLKSAAKGKATIIEVTPSDEEQKKFQEIGSEPVWESWISKMEAKGYKNAREILNATLEMLK